MALDIREWDIKDSLRDAKSIFYHLEVKLEEQGAPYLSDALKSVAEIRGGVDKLSTETRVPLADLTEAIANRSDLPVGVATKVMEAFRPASEAKVA